MQFLYDHWLGIAIFIPVAYIAFVLGRAELEIRRERKAAKMGPPADSPAVQSPAVPTITTCEVNHESDVRSSTGVNALRDGVLKVKGAWEWFEAVGRPQNAETIATIENATYALQGTLDKTPLPPFSRQLLREGVDVMLTAYRKRLLELKTPSERPTAIWESYQALDKLQATDTGYFDRLVAHLDALSGIVPIMPTLRDELCELLAVAYNAGCELMGDRTNPAKLDRIADACATLTHGFETKRELITERTLTRHLYRCVAFYDQFSRAARYGVPLDLDPKAAASAALTNEIELGGAWSNFVNERLATIERMKEVCPDPISAPAIGSIIIHSATFGTEAKFRDVTRKVQDMVSAGIQCIRATNANFGDPAYGEDKLLKIKWSSAGRTHSETVTENGNILVE